MPANVPNVDLPVVVGMHGGGFHAGLSSSLGPDLLLNQDNLIIVSNEKTAFNASSTIIVSVHTCIGDNELSSWTARIFVAEHIRVFRKYGPKGSITGHQMG